MEAGTDPLVAGGYDDEAWWSTDAVDRLGKDAVPPWEGLRIVVWGCRAGGTSACGTRRFPGRGTHFGRLNEDAYGPDRP